MFDAKDAESALDGLTTTSKTAIWRGWINVVAFGHFILEGLWDLMGKTLDEKAKAAIAGDDKWYADRMLEFQYGHSLIRVSQNDRETLHYTIIDEDAQIIKKVAVVPDSSPLVIKVAKESGGELAKLSDAERLAAADYLNDIKFAGTDTQLVSIDPDLVKFNSIKVYYDAKLDLDEFKPTIESAINTYLNGIYFDGIFSINLFRDAIEAVEGTVNGPDLGSIEMKPQNGSYSVVTRDYNPASGYFQIDPAYPLENQIQYIPV